MKCNPYEGILKRMCDNGVGVDAASANETLLAIRHGVNSNNIYYSSPGKTEKDLKQTVDKSNIIADSVAEIEKLNIIAKNQKRRFSIGVRLNVSNAKIRNSKFEVMSGKASQFGIDMPTFMSFLDCNECNAVDIIGIHIYFGSQLMDERVIASNFDIIAQTCLNLRKRLDIRYVNIGGGFGIPYEDNETELNLSLIQSLTEKSEALQSIRNAGIKCNIELGRYLTAQAGIFVTRVIDIKTSFGEKFCVVQGGMNTFIRPVLTGQTHKIVSLGVSNESKLERINVTGSLCTPLDVFAKNVYLPRLCIGDFIMFKNAGAYGYSMSMLNFISHNLPLQIIHRGGRLQWTQ